MQRAKCQPPGVSSVLEPLYDAIPALLIQCNWITGNNSIRFVLCGGYSVTNLYFASLGEGHILLVMELYHLLIMRAVDFN